MIVIYSRYNYLFNGDSLKMDTSEVLDETITNVSYLCARDPSILTWGGHWGMPEQNAQQLLEETEISTTVSSAVNSENDGLLQVYLRIKKSENFDTSYEIVDDQSLLCKVPAGAQCLGSIRDGQAVTKVFKFSKIFGPTSTQLELFNNVIKAEVLKFINGLNCSLLTYGASGSGKTFTIIGTAEQPGIVPRALEYMFRTLPRLPEYPCYKPTVEGGIKRLIGLDCKTARDACLHLINTLTPNSERIKHARTYRAMQDRLSAEPVAVILEDTSHINLCIWVSFAEIYNEHVFDLLKGEPPARGLQRQKLRVGYSNGAAYIKDLTWVNVTSGLEAYHILQYGLQKLNYAATTLNDHSSRSHSIFTIKLVQASYAKEEGVSISSFSFCDLAGSGRIKKTNHVGDRLKESNNIDISLLVLGRCISLLRESQKRNENILIPFRESKITQLFQRALQGLESISMIVHINPVQDMFDESQHVLNFSAIAKDCIVEKKQLFVPALSKKLSAAQSSDFNSTERQKLLDEIKLMHDELEQQRLNYEEDKQRIVNTYEKVIENTKKLCEDHRKQLRDNMLAKRIIDNQDCSEIPSIKRKISIINLDSSDEEDSAVVKDNKEAELEAKQKVSRTCMERCCHTLENKVKELDSENFKLKEQLVELNDYLNAIQQTKSDFIEDEENSEPNSYKFTSLLSN